MNDNEWYAFSRDCDLARIDENGRVAGCLRNDASPICLETCHQTCCSKLKEEKNAKWRWGHGKGNNEIWETL